MFLFLRLILGHFVGDFILQSDEVYAAKKKGFGGASIHYFIIFITLLAFSSPYLDFLGCWAVVTAATLIHLVQDEIKIRVRVPSKLNFVFFIFDQILHIIFLSPILLFKFAYIPPSADSIGALIYSNDFLVILLIGYIVSVFGGAYLWEAFKISYSRKPFSFDNYLLKYGMFERFIITTSFLHLYFLTFLFIPLLFRFLSKRLSFSGEAIANFFYASLIGLFVRQFLL